MASKRTLTRDETAAAYHEQWAFLRKSCAAFDAGDETEAKRIATSLRILLHDTKRSTSLLTQLKLKDALFFDTAENVNNDNLLPTFGLVLAHYTGTDCRFVAPIEKPLGRPIWMIPFEYWWRKRVVRVPEQFELTRADLVLTLADQDGGAHADDAIEERYYRLSRENAMGYTFTLSDGPSIPVSGVERASVRQIAHECLVSLIQPRRMIPPDLPPSEPPARIVVTVDARTGIAERRTPPVHNMCPCNSGLEYHQCHARGAANEGKIVTPRVT
ncbi:MAG: SEC-C metal-binding domain-containing protein [Gemmatimonadaceae bacterium]